MRSYLQEKTCAVKSWQIVVRKAPQRLSALRTLPRHIVFTLSLNFDKKNSFFYLKHSLYTFWSNEWIFRLSAFDVRPLIHHGCGVYAVWIMLSITVYLRARMISLAARAFANGEVMRFFTWRLITEMMLNVPNARTVYEECLIAPPPCPQRQDSLSFKGLYFITVLASFQYFCTVARHALL